MMQICRRAKSCFGVNSSPFDALNQSFFQEQLEIQRGSILGCSSVFIAKDFFSGRQG